MVYQFTKVLICFCSFLVEEWSYLRQQVAPSDLLIEEEIWEVLPEEIVQKKIAVNIFSDNLTIIFSCLCSSAIYSGMG